MSTGANEIKHEKTCLPSAGTVKQKLNLPFSCSSFIFLARVLLFGGVGVLSLSTDATRERVAEVNEKLISNIMNRSI